MDLQGAMTSCDKIRFAIAALLQQGQPKAVDAVTLKRLCMRLDLINPSLAEDFYKQLLNKRDAMQKSPFEKCLMHSWRCLAIQRCRKRGKCVRYFLGECAKARAGSRLERLAFRQAVYFARRIKDPALKYICQADIQAVREDLKIGKSVSNRVSLRPEVEGL